MKIRESHGIILCRLQPNRAAEFLMVHRRYTYEFSEFVLGRSKIATKYLRHQLANMTHEELVTIATLDFDRMWFHIWCNSYQNQLYKKAKTNYTLHFLRDGGKKLTQLIGQTQSRGSLNWDFPRGGARSNESSLQAAVRELEEETGVPRQVYRVIPDVRRVVAYTCGDCQYIFNYHIAIAKPKLVMHNFFIKTTSGQVGEVGEVRWMNSLFVQLVDKSGRLLVAAKAAANCARRWAKAKHTNSRKKYDVSQVHTVVKAALAAHLA